MQNPREALARALEQGIEAPSSMTSRIGEALTSVCTRASIEGKRNRAVMGFGSRRRRSRRRAPSPPARSLSPERERRSQQVDDLRPADPLRDSPRAPHSPVCPPIGPHTATASRPPGASTRHISRSAETASPGRTSAQTGSPRHRTRRPRTADRRRRPAATRSRARRRRATASMRGLRSSPITRPSGADSPRGLSRHDAGPAADVEHPVATADARQRRRAGAATARRSRARSSARRVTAASSVTCHASCSDIGSTSFLSIPGQPDARPSPLA